MEHQIIVRIHNLKMFALGSIGGRPAQQQPGAYPHTNSFYSCTQPNCFKRFRSTARLQKHISDCSHPTTMVHSRTSTNMFVINNSDVFCGLKSKNLTLNIYKGVNSCCMNSLAGVGATHYRSNRTYLQVAVGSGRFRRMSGLKSFC